MFSHKKIILITALCAVMLSGCTGQTETEQPEPSAENEPVISDTAESAESSDVTAEPAAETAPGEPTAEAAVSEESSARDTEEAPEGSVTFTGLCGEELTAVPDEYGICTFEGWTYFDANNFSITYNSIDNPPPAKGWESSNQVVYVGESCGSLTLESAQTRMSPEGELLGTHAVFSGQITLSGYFIAGMEGFSVFLPDTGEWEGPSFYKSTFSSGDFEWVSMGVPYILLKPSAGLDLTPFPLDEPVHASVTIQNAEMWFTGFTPGTEGIVYAAADMTAIEKT